MNICKKLCEFGKRDPKSRLYKFLMVGVLNTCVGYALFAFLIWIGLPYPLAVGLSTAVGVCFNFLTTGRFVFDNASTSRIGRFFAAYGAIYLLNLVCIAALLSLNVNIYMANAIIIPPLALTTYFLQLNFVFKSS